MNEIKMCKDCVFFRSDLSGFEFGRCTYNPEVNLINGEAEYKFAITQRKFEHNCGRDGRYFQKRPYRPFYNLIIAAIALLITIVLMEQL